LFKALNFEKKYISHSQLYYYEKEELMHDVLKVNSNIKILNNNVLFIFYTEFHIVLKDTKVTAIMLWLFNNNLKIYFVFMFKTVFVLYVNLNYILYSWIPKL
jgi:4-hydroxy-L-threonine phosphate dehydrogenase PdxA